MFRRVRHSEPSTCWKNWGSMRDDRLQIRVTAASLWKDRRVVSDALLDASRQLGDPLADDVVAQVMASGDVRHVNDLMRELVRNDELVPAALPPEVHAYLRADVMAAGVDHERIDRAQRFFQVWGLQISMSLFCASLPSAYAAANGVKVLYETARLQTDTRRRIFETGQFLMDVMAPGGLGPHGKGLRAVQRVRLMHAAVRRLILGDGTWRTDDWGVPINQEDLAGTMLSFSYVVGEPLPRLGIQVTRRDADDYIYAWNVIGEMLGVRAELRPNGLDEAADLVATIRRRQNAASPEGKAMTAALVQLLEGMTPHLPQLLHLPHRRRAARARNARLVPIMIRHLIGDEVADLIGVPHPRSGWLRAITPLLRPFGVLETDLERHAHLKSLAEPLAREVLKGVFSFERGGIRTSFAIPDSLARTWELSP